MHSVHSSRCKTLHWSLKINIYPLYYEYLLHCRSDRTVIRLIPLWTKHYVTTEHQKPRPSKSWRLHEFFGPKLEQTRLTVQKKTKIGVSVLLMQFLLMQLYVTPPPPLYTREKKATVEGGGDFLFSPTSPVLQCPHLSSPLLPPAVKSSLRF